MASVARKDAKRFSSLNLGTTYKGAKPESKGAGSKGGFQSLGKIQGKRMPGPAQLPSLRKENAGNDPTVNLVPQAGGGWGAGKEDEQDNRETPNTSSPHPAMPQQDVQPNVQPSRETGVKKETIWTTPEANSVDPTNVAPNQQFKKNFPSLEEREGKGVKRASGNDPHYDHAPVPINEMDSMNSAPAAAVPLVPGHYQYPRGPRPPYPTAPSHVGLPPHHFNRHEYNHYGHPGGSYHGYPPQQQSAPPPHGSTAGGQYPYPLSRYPLHPNHSLPPNMDPYQDGQSKLVKSEELKNLELPDEDDDVGGWAGYHEEVDYSKKVVFEDSSDEEGQENRHQEQQRPPKRKESHEIAEPRDVRMQATPHTAVDQPHPRMEQPTRHFHHPPQADVRYSHPPPPPHGVSGHYPMYYPPTGAPQRGYPMARPVDKERPQPPPRSQPDPHLLWQQGRKGPRERVPVPEAAWGEERLISPPAINQNSTGQATTDNEQLDKNQQPEQTAFDGTDSVSTGAIVSVEKKHVTFHFEQAHQVPHQVPQQMVPATRQPMKIMMRDMKVTPRDEHDQSAANESFHPSNVGKPSYHHQRSNDSDQGVTSVDKSAHQQPRVSAWMGADRGPITTPRTLYEPEGDKSAKKFNALIKQTSGERGKRNSSVSDTVQDSEQTHSPTGDIKILKSDDKPSRSKHQPTAASPDPTANNKSQPQQFSSNKNKTEGASAAHRKGPRKEKPAFRQYQPPPARDQDELVYSSETKGGGSRRTSRHDYNYDHHQQQQGSKGPRRRDQQYSGHYSEGKHQPERRQHAVDGRHHAEGKTQSEGKYQPSEGKRHNMDGGNKKDRPRKGREASKEMSVNEQTEHAGTASVTGPSKDDAGEPGPLQDEKGKQSGKDSQSKGASSGGETKQQHQKKKTGSSSAAQKSDTTGGKDKQRSRGRNRNDDWYYSEEYYNQWYEYYYDYYDEYPHSYYSERRAPSGRPKQQQSFDSGKYATERRDNAGRKPQQQQQNDRGSNRPARTRGGDRKDEQSDEKGQQHRATKDKGRVEATSDEIPAPKLVEEGDAKDRGRRKDTRPQQDVSVDKRRSNRPPSTSGKGNTQPLSAVNSNKPAGSHDPPSGRGQSRTGRTSSSSQERSQQPDDPQQPGTTAAGASSKKEPAAIKDKAASAKMATVDFNSPTVVVIDDEHAVPLSPGAAEVDDFIRVTSKKEKRELKEQEKHRQQERQRKAEEEEHKRKQHSSSKKSSQKTKHHQHHQQSQEQLLSHDQDVSSVANTWPSNTSSTNASVWTESITNLLNDGQTGYIAAAASSLMSSGDYQLFPTSYGSSGAVPLAHLSAAVDSSVAQDLTTPTATQGHTLAETEVKSAGLGRPDTSAAGHGSMRTDLPASKSHSPISVGGAIGRGRGSSSSRAPGSNRGSTSTRDSNRKLPISSSDSQVSTSPKISKPSTAVRSKPSASTSDKVSSADRLTSSTGKKISTKEKVSRPAREVVGSGSSRRAGSHSVATRTKSSKQRPHRTQTELQNQQKPSTQLQSSPASTTTPTTSPSGTGSGTAVSYAGAVKASQAAPVTKPVAYVRPTPSVINSTKLHQQQEDAPTTTNTTTITATNTTDPLPNMVSSFPTAYPTQELLEDTIIVTADEQSSVVTKQEPAVVSSYVSPVVSESSVVAPAVSTETCSSFTPFTFVATQSTASIHTSVPQAVVVSQASAVSSTVQLQPTPDGQDVKEGAGEVEEIATKRIRLGTSTAADHSSTKLNIEALPFVPSTVTTTSHHAAPVMVATPSHKISSSTHHQLPTATMMSSIVPIVVPHPQMGGRYAVSQQAVYPPVFPSQVYPQPSSMVGLPYAGYPIQQPGGMAPSTGNGHVPMGVAPNYGLLVPAHNARIEQRKKEEKMKVINDTKRFFEQNSVTQQQPPMYNFPVSMATSQAKQLLSVTGEVGRRPLLENPPVAMTTPILPHPSAIMNRPLEFSSGIANPSIGNKRRRPPLMPLPQLPATMTTVWDKPTNMLY